MKNSILFVLFFTLYGFECDFFTGDEDVIFGVSQKFDNGKIGSTIDANEHFVVEIHETDNETLWYRVGEIRGLRIKWTESKRLDENGSNADVTLNEKNEIIVVFEFNGELFYKIGILENYDVFWRPAKVYDNGTNPSVGLTSNGTVVEVHEVNGIFFSNLGRLTTNYTVEFSSYTILTKGSSADVSINCMNEIIMVHYLSYTLYYTVGLVVNDVIVWGNSKLLQSGAEISGAINTASQVVLAYRKHDNQTYSVVGVLDSENKTVKWSTERTVPTENGKHISVTVNRRLAALAHSGGITTSLIRDRKRWMELSENILDKSLWELTLPGSHDAGAYSLSTFRVQEGCKAAPDFIPGIFTKQYAETQNENLLEQLNNGVRYFDIRPYYWPTSEGGTNDFHIYHDNIGSRISRVMYLVKTFLESVNRELVILRFSHFCELNFARGPLILHTKLTQIIRNGLAGYILNFDAEDTSVIRTKLADMVKHGPKVLIVYDNDFALDISQNAFGFLRNRPYFDKYSNTDNISVMQSDQLEKLKLNHGTESRLFLLSYTLTFQLATFSTTNAKTLQELTKNASRTLADFVDEYSQYVINLLFVDFCSEARVTDVAIVANEKRFKNLH